ncbi:MAG: hypothetical protein AMS15_07125 [Planctomycetes bacterium DG_23]|nr:MAG: hypothetical protein AMS15_07125 [Planctomycetes bacterium DG_23]
MLAGCGYSNIALIPTDINTVAVGIFQNDTFYRGLEFELTRALVQEIERRTHLKVVERERADTLLTGTITEVYERVLVEDQADQPTEKQITIVINFRWEDLRSGEVIVSRNNFRQTAEYIIPAGETLITARSEAFADVAERIVEQMEGGW